MENVNERGYRSDIGEMRGDTSGRLGIVSSGVHQGQDANTSRDNVVGGNTPASSKSERGTSERVYVRNEGATEKEVSKEPAGDLYGTSSSVSSDRTTSVGDDLERRSVSSAEVGREILQRDNDQKINYRFSEPFFKGNSSIPTIQLWYKNFFKGSGLLVL